MSGFFKSKEAIYLIIFLIVSLLSWILVAFQAGSVFLWGIGGIQAVCAFVFVTAWAAKRKIAWDNKLELEKTNQKIEEINALCRRLRTGDLEHRFHYVNSFGNLTETVESLNDFFDRIESFMRESQAAMTAVKDKKYYRKIIETGQVGAFLLGAKVINEGILVMENKTRAFGEIAESFFRNVFSSIEVVASAVAELDATIGEMTNASEGSQKASENLTGLVKGVNQKQIEISNGIKELVLSINKVQDDSQKNRELTNQGDEMSKQSSAFLEELQESAEKISQVVDLISTINKRTNLLALNANIEAANAGNAGKGFAIVSNEVKNLSVQTTEATGDIQKNVNEIQSIVQNTVDSVNEFRKVVSVISANVASISEQVYQQSHVTEDFSHAVEEVKRDSQIAEDYSSEVSQAVTMSYNATNEIRVASGDLTQQAEMLRESCQDFYKKIKELV